MEIGREAGTGKYTYKGKWDRLCTCGHTLGTHAAATVDGERPCFDEDINKDGKVCNCTKFQLSKSNKV